MEQSSPQYILQLALVSFVVQQVLTILIMAWNVSKEELLRFNISKRVS